MLFAMSLILIREALRLKYFVNENDDLVIKKFLAEKARMTFIAFFVTSLDCT